MFGGSPPFGITAEDLLRAGIEPEVIAAVVILTRAADNKGDAYYDSIRDHPVALAVKLADIADNLDPTRTANLDPGTRERLPEKYGHARTVLRNGSQVPDN